MKKHSIYLFMAILFISSPLPAYAEDIQVGFQGIKWGASIDSNPDFEELYTKNDVKYYIYPMKSYEINGTRLTDVIYGAYAGSFCAVYIKINEPEIFAEIKSYLKTKYGLPKTSFSVKNDEAVESWKEKNIKFKLKHNEKSWETKLAFYYMPISQNIDEEVQEEEFSRKGIHVLPREERGTYDSYPLLVF